MTGEDGEARAKAEETYFAKVNIFTHMAHYIAKKLHLRPNSVLDDWGVPELVVAYGIYKNEESAKYHAEVKAHNKGLKGSDRMKVPPMYAVKFMGTEEEDVSQDPSDRSHTE